MKRIKFMIKETKIYTRQLTDVEDMAHFILKRYGSRKGIWITHLENILSESGFIELVNIKLDKDNYMPPIGKFEDKVIIREPTNDEYIAVLYLHLFDECDKIDDYKCTYIKSCGDCAFLSNCVSNYNIFHVAEEVLKNKEIIFE